MTRPPGVLEVAPGATIHAMSEDAWPAVFDRVWRPVVAAGGTYVYEPDTPMELARQLWCLPAPARQWWVAQHGQPVATALLKPNQPGAGAHVANAAFMVAPTAAGRGLGRGLAGWVIDEACSAGFSAMQFNAVVSDNSRAIRLWESLGFATIGRVPGGYQRAGESRDLLIMHRHLALALTEC